MVRRAWAAHDAAGMRKFLTLVGVLLLFGCASSGDTWTKAGTTEQEQGQDTSACLTAARRVMATRNGPVTTVDQTRYRDCMADRGYTMGPGTRER